MKKIIIAILAGLLLDAAALASPAPQPGAKAESAISQLSKKEQFTIVKQFPTDQPGLTGYVIKTRSGRTQMVFGMGAYIFSGTLIDAQGHNASKAYADAELPKPDYAAVAATLAKSSHLIDEGRKGAPIAYVFADPNCIFCHKFWEQTRSWVKAGKLQLRWVMVGFLKGSSPGRAAAIMAAKDGAAALFRDETKFDPGKEEGAIKPLDPVPEKYKRVLAFHAHLMSKLNFDGTPSLIFQDKSGKWQGVTGLPRGNLLPKAMGFKP